MSRKFWSFKSFSKQKQPEIKVDKEEVRKKLTPLQFRITQDKATERPFSGEFLKLKDNGMYACVVCDQELFSSACKYDSGCGWPAFYDAQDTDRLILKPDLSHVGSNLLLLAIKPDLVRTEVTCGKCGAHLGHVFDDGPKPTGLRYCINSAALKFTKSEQIAAGNTTPLGASDGLTKAVDSNDVSKEKSDLGSHGRESLLENASHSVSSSTLKPDGNNLVSINNNSINPMISRANDRNVACNMNESPGNLRHKLRMEFYYGTPV